jgi:hypothetical protein
MIVFLDEIHRFTRSQQVSTPLLLSLSSLTYFGSQEVFIPFIEQGFVQVSNTVNY